MAKSTEGDKKLSFCRFLIPRRKEVSLFLVTLGSLATDGGKKKEKKNQQREERRGDFEEWRCPVLYPLSEQRGSHLFSCADLHAAAAAARARGNRGAAKKTTKRGGKKDKRVELT